MNPVEESPGDKLKALAGRARAAALPWLAALRDRYLALDRKMQIGIAAGAGVLILALALTGGGSGGDSNSLTFAARRGNLDITVLEGGALEALQSQEIRSRVRDRSGVKILSIVEEGYRVTEEDVAAGMILVELDTSSLVDNRLSQEIAVETSEAAFIERRAAYEIQLNTNMTQLNDARQQMRFARLDFEKFLGADIVNDIIARLEIEERLAASEAADRAVLENAETARTEAEEPEAAPSGLPEGIEIESLPPPMQNRIRQMMAENGGQLPPEMVERMQRFASGEFPSGGRPLEIGDRIEEVAVLELPPSDIDPVPPEVTLLMDESYMEIRDRIDFTQYADFEELADGEAKQRLRILLDELQVAQEEYLLAQDRIEGQRRLEARGFITPTELEAEELNLNKAANKQQEKETALRLYIQYTFPKEAEEFLSNYENAVMAYQRQVKENIAREAQELANFSSAERKFNLEKYKLADIEAQIDAATIEAELPGLVVYGGSDQGSSRYRSSSQEAIQEGATVRERQPILTIPDMREMAVSVDIHESAVQRVAVGQPAVILIDAYPDVRLTGEVIKVAVVADSANSFMNPDLKVYPSQVRIDGTHDWLRPGMSAQVEILVASHEDVIYVPVQAVNYFGTDQVVYVRRGGSVERRIIEVGDFSDSFIEVVSGLEEGEEVLLLPPREQLESSAA
ncbi:MAG: HlyD family efflux transporter periplasmic adaptor subunit [Gammaproteobacteria bacterium]|nr:HlyD family efflux transporter periplasmic adaptor subunit [Gammaproteobacteria bacterium]